MSDIAEMLASAKAKGYKEGREDVIDELAELMKQYVDFENVDVFVETLRQLKEQTE